MRIADCNRKERSASAMARVWFSQDDPSTPIRLSPLVLEGQRYPDRFIAPVISPR